MKHLAKLTSLFLSLSVIFYVHESFAYNDTIMFHDSIYNVPYSTTIYDNALTDPVQFDDDMNGNQDDLDVEMPSLNPKQNVRQKNYLIQAVQDNNYYRVENVVHSKKCNVNYQDRDGRTALHYAAVNDNRAIVQLLLESNLDVNIVDNEGWTALHVAVDKNAYNVVQMLIDHNADRDAKNLDGMTPFDYARNDMIKAILNNN